MAGLLVSVQAPDEVADALAGGADMIDIKNPSAGAMGRPDRATLEAVMAEISRLDPGHRVPVSVALGELVEWLGRDPVEYPLPRGVRYAKLGLSACDRRDWKPALREVIDKFTRGAAPWQSPVSWVAVAYADQSWSRSPAPLEILRFAESAGLHGLLLDTWEKANANTLGDWFTTEELQRLIAQTRLAGMMVGLAGSLGPHEIHRLGPLAPDVFGVRGAACRQADRQGRLSPKAVRQLAELAHAAVVAPADEELSLEVPRPPASGDGRQNRAGRSGRGV